MFFAKEEMFEDTTMTNLSHISKYITGVPSGSGNYNWYTNYIRADSLIM
jgi:protein involved in ribonucleotide reduction